MKQPYRIISLFGPRPTLTVSARLVPVVAPDLC